MLARSSPAPTKKPLPADAFKRAGIVERTAHCIDTIFDEAMARPALLYVCSNKATVSIVILGGENLDFVRLLVTKAQQGHNLALDELLILNALGQTREPMTDESARSSIQADEPKTKNAKKSPNQEIIPQ